jgi:GAF domain-containing protein
MPVNTNQQSLDQILDKLSSQIRTQQDTQSQLSKVNKEIYERNVELALHNRMLSALRKIYEIINTSLGVKETAEKLIESIIQEIKFQKGFIALIDKQKKILKVVAVSESISNGETKHAKFDRLFKHLEISLHDKNNVCISCIVSKQQHMTNDLSDIFTHHIDENTAQEIAKTFNIQTSLVYPIIFADDAIGVMMVGIDKHIGFLSRAERDILNELTEVVGIAIERAQIYTDLKDANHRLKELDKLKDEFVSIASHELRTPMTAVRSYLWLALNKPPQKLDLPNV